MILMKITYEDICEDNFGIKHTFTEDLKEIWKESSLIGIKPFNILTFDIIIISTAVSKL